MLYLTLEEILRLHFQLIEDYGGSHGMRDEARLLSIGQAPQQQIFGAEQYPDLCEKAAVYMRNIIADHAFADGNKCTAVTVAGVFLMRNNNALTATPNQLENFAVQIAVERLDIPTIAAWLRTHSREYRS